MEVEDLTTGQRITVESNEPRLMSETGFTSPGDGTRQEEIVYAVLLDLELADAVRADDQMVWALADHLETRAGLAVIRPTRVSYAAAGRWASPWLRSQQLLMAFLGYPDAAGDYQHAWDTVEDLLSKRFDRRWYCLRAESLTGYPRATSWSITTSGQLGVREREVSGSGCKSPTHTCPS